MGMGAMGSDAELDHRFGKLVLLSGPCATAVDCCCGALHGVGAGMLGIDGAPMGSGEGSMLPGSVFDCDRFTGWRPRPVGLGAAMGISGWGSIGCCSSAGDMIGAIMLLRCA